MAWTPPPREIRCTAIARKQRQCNKRAAMKVNGVLFCNTHGQNRIRVLVWNDRPYYVLPVLESGFPKNPSRKD